MGPSDFGTFYYVISIISLFQVLSVLGLDTIAVRDISRYRAKTSEVLENVMTLRWLGTLLAVAAALIYGAIFAPEFFDLIVIGVICLMSLPLDTGEFLYQANSDLGASTKIRISAFLSGSAIRIFLALTNAPLIYFMMSWSFEYVFMNLALYFRYRFAQAEFIGLGRNILIMKRLIKSAAPLLIFALAGVFALKMDVLFVGYFYEKTQIGIYGFAVRLVELIYVLPLAIAMSAVPFLASNGGNSYDSNKKRIEELITYSTWLGIIAAAGTFYLVPFFISTFYGDQYLDSIRILKIYSFVLPFIFSGAVRNYIWIAYGKEWTLALTTLPIVLVLPFYYYYAVPRENLEYVAWTFVGTVALINFFMSIIDRKMLQFQLHGLFPWKLLKFGIRGVSR